MVNNVVPLSIQISNVSATIFPFTIPL